MDDGIEDSISVSSEIDVDFFSGFSGDWNDISAEDIRESRTFTRNVETW